jgi:hypothetical protein
MVGATPSFPRIPTWRGTFPLDRCAACDRRLTQTDEAPVGQFPIFTPDRLLLIRCRMCAQCLDQPELRDPPGLRRQALALVARLWHWWVEYPSEPDPAGPEIPVPAASDPLAQRRAPTGSRGDVVPPAVGNPACRRRGLEVLRTLRPPTF